jgi:transposase
MREREAIKERFELLTKEADERKRRQVAAAEALVLGRGGISAVARITGVSRAAISRGIKELQTDADLAGNRIRKKGAGRKKKESSDPSVYQDLERLVEPESRGDPESPLRWTCKSTRKLAKELGRMGHRISHQTVAKFLHQLGYSLQANSKTREGGDNPDRDAQFNHINSTTKQFLEWGEPAISVDAKKKELVGDLKNAGVEWHPKGQPEHVRVYDFPIPELGRVTPYGIYDLQDNSGWVNVGVDHDTASFAVESIRRWWNTEGRHTYQQASQLLVCADGGGSNGSRVRLWKWELQQLADETGLSITVCHLPPGTSKWNKIEHRLFSFISQNWRGKPLVSYEVILKLISATSNEKGLTVQSCLDTTAYPRGISISDEQMATLNIQHDLFHGEWNYTILPR